MKLNDTIKLVTMLSCLSILTLASGLAVAVGSSPDLQFNVMVRNQDSSTSNIVKVNSIKITGIPQLVPVFPGYDPNTGATTCATDLNGKTPVILSPVESSACYTTIQSAPWTNHFTLSYNISLNGVIYQDTQAINMTASTDSKPVFAAIDQSIYGSNGYCQLHIHKDTDVANVIYIDCASFGV